MKAIILSFFLGWSLCALGQPGFIKTFYTDGNQQEISEYRDVLIDHDTIVMYSSSFDENNDQGIRFAKIDSFGNVLQETIVVDSLQILTTTFFRKKIVRTKDGGYAVYGSAGLKTNYLLKVNHNLEFEFLVKYVDSNGATLLNTTFIEVSDGFLLVGRYQYLDHENDVLVIKTDSQGNEVWRKIYDEEDGVNEIIIEIKPVGDDFLLMGDKSDDLFPQQSTWSVPYLLSIDGQGNVNWTWTMDQGELPASFRDGVMLSDSSWIFTSVTWEWNEEDGQYASRPMVLRLDKDFNVVWQQVFGVLNGLQWFTDLEQTKDGQFVASGNLWHGWGEFNWYSSAVHYKFSAHGDSLWMRQDSVLQYAYLMGTDVMSTGSIVSVGYSQKFNPNGGVFGFLMKIGAGGCIDTLNCWLVDNLNVADLAGVEVFPNPVGEVLGVRMSQAMGYIHLYDALGHFLRKLRLSRGYNELIVSDLPKGMLFYEVWDTHKNTLIGRGKLVKE